MLLGEPEMGTVVAFALVGGWEPDQDDGHIGVTGHLDGLGDQRVIPFRALRVIRALEVITAGVREPGPAAAELVERRTDPERVDQRTACSLISGLLREGTDHGDRPVGRQR